jgi:hypothetical protein
MRIGDIKAVFVHGKIRITILAKVRANWSVEKRIKRINNFHRCEKYKNMSIKPKQGVSAGKEEDGVDQTIENDQLSASKRLTIPLW